LSWAILFFKVKEPAIRWAKLKKIPKPGYSAEENEEVGRFNQHDGVFYQLS